MVEDWQRPNAVTLQVPEHLLDAYCAPGSVKFLNEGVEPSMLFLQVYRSEDFSTTTHIVFDIGEVKSDERAYEILDRLGANELTEQEMVEQRQSPATFDSFLRSAPFLESISLRKLEVSAHTLSWYPHEIPLVDRQTPVVVHENPTAELADSARPVEVVFNIPGWGPEEESLPNMAEAVSHASKLVREATAYAPAVQLYFSPPEGSEDRQLVATVRPALQSHSYGLVAENRYVSDDIEPERVIAVGFLPWV